MSSVDLATRFQTNLDDYHIGRELGRGGYGRVFLAKNKQSQHMYAVKQIPKTHIHHKESIVRELAVLRRLSQEPGAEQYISKYYGYIELDNVMLIFMQYIPGKDIMKMKIDNK